MSHLLWRKPGFLWLWRKHTRRRPNGNAYLHSHRLWRFYLRESRACHWRMQVVGMGILLLIEAAFTLRRLGFGDSVGSQVQINLLFLTGAYLICFFVGLAVLQWVNRIDTKGPDLMRAGRWIERLAPPMDKDGVAAWSMLELTAALARLRDENTEGFRRVYRALLAQGLTPGELAEAALRGGRRRMAAFMIRRQLELESGLAWVGALSAVYAGLITLWSYRAIEALRRNGPLPWLLLALGLVVLSTLGSIVFRRPGTDTWAKLLPLILALAAMSLVLVHPEWLESVLKLRAVLR